MDVVVNVGSKGYMATLTLNSCCSRAFIASKQDLHVGTLL
jgi:hypothetical protein